MPTSIGESAGDLDRLSLSRRIDWRFLLAEPDLGDVAFIGDDAALLESLEAFSRSVAVLGRDRRTDCQSVLRQVFDLVVMKNPSQMILRSAEALLKPGGRLYAEVTRPRLLSRRRWLSGRSCSASRLIAALRRPAVFDPIELYWHWPDFEHATRILPLSDLAAVKHQVEARAGRLASRVVSAVGQLARNGRLLRSLIPHLSIVARRRDDSSAAVPFNATADQQSAHRAPQPSVPENFLVRFLREHRSRLGLERLGVPERLTTALVTPRFRTSAHVVALLSPEGRGEPVLVAKIPRLAEVGRLGNLSDDASGAAREAECLKVFHARWPGGFDSVPRLVAFECCGGRPLLIETAFSGRLLDAKIVRRDPDRCCRAVMSWLAEIDRPAVEPLDSQHDRWERLVERPLAFLQKRLSSNADEQHLCARVRQLADDLRGLALPAVFEHGDLCHPNILLRDDSRLAVVDWELAEPAGLPAADLVFFLTFVAFARERAQTPKARLRAFRNAFFEHGSWAEPYLGEYLERLQVPANAFAPLFVICWTRYLANLLWRLGPGDVQHVGRISNPSERRADGLEIRPTFQSGTHAEWLRRNRYFALWRHAVQYSHELLGQHGNATRR